MARGKRKTKRQRKAEEGRGGGGATRSRAVIHTAVERNGQIHSQLPAIARSRSSVATA